VLPGSSPLDAILGRHSQMPLERAQDEHVGCALHQFNAIVEVDSVAIVVDCLPLSGKKPKSLAPI
jgi:hypothetical protein